MRDDIKNPVSGKKVKASSSNKKVATVSVKSNKVTVKGKKAGTCTVTVSYNGKKYKCKITVKAQKLSATSVTLNKGSSKTLKLSYLVKGKAVKASSTDTKVVKVTSVKDGNIKIKAVGVGKATLKVVHDSKTYKCTVKVKGTTTETNNPSQSETNTPAQSETNNPAQSETNKPTQSETNKPTQSETNKPAQSETNAPETNKPAQTEPETEAPAKKPETLPETETPAQTEPATEAPVKQPETEEVKETGSEVSTETESSASPETNPPETDAPETDPPETSAPETDAPETINYISISDQYRNITISDPDRTGYTCFTTSLDDNSIFWKASSVNIEFCNFSTLPSGTKKLSFWGRCAGTYQITITGGGISEVVNVTVTYDDTDWIVYDSWIRQVLSQCGYPNDAPLEVFKKLGAYLVDNCSYNEDNTMYKRVNVIGGDCLAHTDLFIDVAKRFYGFEAYLEDSVAIPGHMYAVVNINGVKWSFDAGTGGTAGNRSFSMGNGVTGYLYNKKSGWR